MSRAELSHERLREVYSYDPETGHFVRLAGRAGPLRVGARAGCLDRFGYVWITTDYIRHLGHRLAWFYVHGKWPTYNIDHINGNKSDNRIANLRDVTHQVNVQNRRTPMRRNKLGILGVFKLVDAYKASIGVDNRVIFLGTFRTAEAASAAYQEAKRRYHPGAAK